MIILLFALSILFGALKLAGVLSLSWFIVALPAIIGAALFVIAIVAVLSGVTVMASLNKNQKLFKK